MRLEFPRIIEYLHWRLVGCNPFPLSADIDVSTVRFLSKNWSPGIKDASPPTKKEHRAMDDIRESIEELKYYKESLWRVTQQ